MKYSLIFSFIFCLCCLKLLFDEKFDEEVSYKFREEIKDKKSLDYRFCLNLKEAYKFYFNKTELNTQLIKDEISTLFNKFESSQGFGRLTELYKDKFNNLFKNLFYKRIMSNEYFIYKNLICLASNENELKITSRMNYQLLSLSKISGFYFLFFNESLSLININSYNQNSQIDQIVVLNEPFPYSNCQSNFSRLICLNECFKLKYKLSKYYYAAEENVTIELDYDRKNASIIEHEKSCVSHCKDESCKLSYFPSSFRVKNDNLNDKFNNETYKISYYQAVTSISLLDFFLQFFGICFLLFDLSIYGILLYHLKCVLVKLKCLKKIILIFKFILVLICLLVFIFLAAIFLLSYVIDTIEPIQKQLITSLLKPEAIGVIICYNAQFFNFKNKTFLDLENATNKNIENIIEDVYIEFGGREVRKGEFNVSSKVYFKFNGFLRCLRIEVEPKDPILNSRLLTPKLSVKFKKDKTDCEWTSSMYFSSYNFVYILPGGYNFNSDSYQVHSDESYVKKEIKRSIRNGKCIDYNQKKYKKLKCSDQKDCLEKCFSKELFRKYSKVIDDTVIDSEQFSKDEWSTRKIVESINQIDLPSEIRNECEMQFPKPSCNEAFFESGVLKTEKDYCDKYEFDLIYDVIEQIEEGPSRYGLILDIFILISLVFGLSIFKFAVKIMKVCKFKPDQIKPKSYLRSQPFPYIICFLGILAHLSLIFKETIDADLVKSQHYETQESIRSSDVVFCLNYTINTTNSNDHLTYNKLEELAKDLNPKILFDKIIYLNESNDWHTLDRNLDFKDKNYQISTFYFFNYKCFQLQTNLIYKNENLLFEDHVLKVKFNKSFIENKSVLFFTKQRDTFYLSKFRHLDVYQSRSRSSDVQTYSVKEEPVQITRSSRYLGLMKFFCDRNDRADVNKYMKSLLENFREKQNFTTLTAPLESKVDTNDLAINDEKFEAFIKDQKSGGRAYESCSNYHREYFIHHMNVTHYQYFPKEYHFAFSLSSFKRIIKETNRDNIAKIILLLLNLFSLWLGKNPLTLFVFENATVNETVKKVLFRKSNDKFDNRNKVEDSESDQHKASNRINSILKDQGSSLNIFKLS